MRSQRGDKRVSTNGHNMKDDTEYTYMAERYSEEMRLGQGSTGFSADAFNHFSVFIEETDELEDAMLNGSVGDVAEEAADVLITVFVLADIMNIDISSAYNEKMLYNIQKSGEKDENGKVIDDVEMDKPDFHLFTDGYML